MIKSTVLLGGVCVAAMVCGGMYFTSRGEKVSPLVTTENIAVSSASQDAYWDGKSDINTPAADGVLPLAKAVKAQDVKWVKKFIDKGARANAVGTDNVSVLETGLEVGNMEIIKMLMEEARSILNAPKYMKAAMVSGKAEVVKEVLEHGGDVNAIIDIKGRYRPDEELDYMDPRVSTPLKEAVEKGQTKVVEVLLDKGADGVPYFFSQELKKGNTEMVKVLVKKAGNLRSMAVSGSDILTASVVEATPDMLDFLLKENAGDVNRALLNMVLKRDVNNQYDDAVKQFLNAGATPTADVLQTLIKKGKTQLFADASACLTKSNIKTGDGQESMLRYTLEHKKIDEVKILLEQGADVWKADADGKTPFFVATQLAPSEPKFYNLFKSELKDINESGYRGETILMLVAAAGLNDEFMKLVDAGADIWQKDLTGKTVLMYAAEGGNMEAIKYLISKGDNLEMTDSAGRNALMYAAEAGQTDTCRELLYKGVNARQGDNKGKTAAMYAASRGHADTVKLLLDAGESHVAQDKNRKNMMMYAAESGDLATLNEIVSKGVDMSLTDRDGVSALSYGVKGNNPDVVGKLLQLKSDIYSRDHNGYQAYTYALIGKNKKIIDMVKLSLMNAIYATKDTGKTLGMRAVEANDTDLIREVMRYNGGKYATISDNNGDNFVLYMAQYGRPDMVREMIDSHINYRTENKKHVNYLMYAAQSEYAVNLVTFLGLLNRNSDVINSRDSQDRTALMYAVGGKYNQAIKQQRLISMGAKVNAEDRTNKSVLMYAVGNPEALVDAQAVLQLISQGGRINAADKNGKTVLMYAVGNANASVNVVEVLLKNGADLNAKDTQGKSVLMYAAESGDISKFRLLFEAGAPAGGRTKDGKSVTDLAAEVGPCFAKAVKNLL